MWLLITNIGRLFTATEAGVIVQAAVLVDDGRIVWAGPAGEVPGGWDERIDVEGALVTPGLVDAHTHPVYAGDRLGEIALRSSGAGYQEIAAAGGGIRATVAATRAAGEAELAHLVRARLVRWLASGTTTVEAKTGYHLDRAGELSAVRLLAALTHDPRDPASPLAPRTPLGPPGSNLRAPRPAPSAAPGAHAEPADDAPGAGAEPAGGDVPGAGAESAGGVPGGGVESAGGAPGGGVEGAGGGVEAVGGAAGGAGPLWRRYSGGGGGLPGGAGAEGVRGEGVPVEQVGQVGQAVRGGGAEGPARRGEHAGGTSAGPAAGAAAMVPRVEVTFLGAHDVGPEVAARAPDAPHEACAAEVAGWAGDAATAGARFVDVFCDAGYFSVDQARRVLLAGRTAGLLPRIHADELERTGGSLLAAEVGAVSADHLLCVTGDDARALAAAGVVATLCPVTALALRRTPPARLLVDRGVTLALGSDHNPGQSGTTSMSLVVGLAVHVLGLSVEEALTAATAGGARSLAVADRGVVRPGALADLVAWDADHEGAFAWELGLRPRQVWKGGRSP